MIVIVPSAHRNLLGRKSWRPMTLVIVLVGPERILWGRKTKTKMWKSHDFQLKSGLKG